MNKKVDSMSKVYVVSCALGYLSAQVKLYERIVANFDDAEDDTDIEVYRQKSKKLKKEYEYLYQVYLKCPESENI